MVYLCADRGIPIGGTKGGSVHVRQFLDRIGALGYKATVLAASVVKEPDIPEVRRVIAIPEAKSEAWLAGLLEASKNDSNVKDLIEFYRNDYAIDLMSSIDELEPINLVYERYSLFSVAGLLYARSHNIRYVLEVNAPLIKEAEQYRGLGKVGLVNRIETVLFEGADHIVAVSNQVAVYVRERARRARVTVVPNGFDHHRFPESLVEQSSRKHLKDIADDEIVVGFLGAIKPWHGTELLLDMIEQFSERKSPLRLVLVGDDRQLSNANRVDKLRSRGVLFTTGAVPFEQVPGYLAEMDILVAPYPPLDDFYFSPLKIYEYMAAGKPIIASRIGQIDDILSDGKNAILIEPGNLEQLNEAVLRLSNDPELRQQLGRAARSEAFDHHTWDHRMRLLRTIVEPSRMEPVMGSEPNHAR
jgi:glycosyltransferase involved in cell wall biosynthesis